MTYIPDLEGYPECDDMTVEDFTESYAYDDDVDDEEQ